MTGEEAAALDVGVEVGLGGLSATVVVVGYPKVFLRLSPGESYSYLYSYSTLCDLSSDTSSGRKKRP